MRHALGEKNKPVCVVRVADVVLQIISAAFVKIRLMNEINCQPGFNVERKKFRLNATCGGR
jgi:hypothetical protein